MLARRAWIVMLSVGLVFAAGCGTLTSQGSQASTASGHHSQSGSSKTDANSTAPGSAGGSASQPATSSGGSSPATSTTQGSTGQWACGAAAPPAVAGESVIASSRVTVGSDWFEAAGTAATGCITFYVAPSGTTSWQAYSVTAGSSSGDGVGSLQVAAIDQDHVWVLGTGLPGAGQAPAFLFATQDGGGTWLPEPSSQASPFPHANVPLQMSFTSAQDGWITDLNTFYGPPRVEVYHTTDAGATWALAAFAVPDKYATSFGNAQVPPPVFQNSSRGTLKVQGTMNGIVTTLIYGTSDGGATWLLESAAQNPASGN